MKEGHAFSLRRTRGHHTKPARQHLAVELAGVGATALQMSHEERNPWSARWESAEEITLYVLLNIKILFLGCTCLRIKHLTQISLPECGDE